RTEISRMIAVRRLTRRVTDVDAVGDRTPRGVLAIPVGGRAVPGCPVVSGAVLDTELQGGTERHSVADHQSIGTVALGDATKLLTLMRGSTGERQGEGAMQEVPPALE